MAKRATSVIGQNVRLRRVASGMTQAELAHRLGGADATISRIERGKFAPSQGMVEGLAAALKCSVAALYASAAEPPSRGALRPAQMTLLTVTERMTDAEIEDVVRALKVLLRVGKRTVA